MTLELIIAAQRDLDRRINMLLDAAPNVDWMALHRALLRRRDLKVIRAAFAAG